MIAYLLAVFFLGALVSGPAWMAYGIRKDHEHQEWVARRRVKELRDSS